MEIIDEHCLRPKGDTEIGACAKLIGLEILDIKGGKYTISKKLETDFLDGGKTFDCLRNAERIMAIFNNQGANFNPKGDNSITVVGNHLIGYSNQKNKDAVKSVDKRSRDEHVFPEVGQAYFICRTDTGKASYPYHAAAVIYKDKYDIITLETLGGTIEWFFARYSTYDSISGGNTQLQETFHHVWQKTKEFSNWNRSCITVAIRYSPVQTPEQDMEIDG